MNAEAKAYWRQRVQNIFLDKDKDFDLKASINNLNNEPLNQWAAMSIFWNVYLSENEKTLLTDEQVENIRKMMHKFESSSYEASKDFQLKTFVVECLVGTVLTDRLINEIPPYWAKPVKEAFEEAEIIFKSFEIPSEIDNPSEWAEKCFAEDLQMFTDMLIKGIVCTERSVNLRAQKNYEGAFGNATIGMIFLDLSTINQKFIDGHFSTFGFTPYLPHSLEEFKFGVGDIYEIFAEIKEHINDVKNWDSIASFCELILIEIYRNNIADTESVSYWNRAIEFAQNQSQNNQTAILHRFEKAYEKEGRKKKAEERLQRDFFGKSWDNLEQATRKHLANAELHWDEGQFGDMIRDYRFALENELPKLFQDVLGQDFLGNFNKQNIENRDTPLLLSFITNELTKTNNRLHIQRKKPHTTPRDEILIELVNFLPSFMRTRGISEHLDTSGEVSLDDSKIFRNRLLGIGCKGIFPQIAIMKMK